MSDIRFTTSADLKGFHDLESALDKLHSHVKAVAIDMRQLSVLPGEQAASGGIAVGGSPAPRTGSGPRGGSGRGGGMSQGPGPRAQGGQKSRYDLSTQGGVIEYYENVLAQTLPMLNAMRPSTAGAIGSTGARPRASVMQNVSGMVPLLGNNFKSRHMAGSTPYYEDYFNRVGQADVQSMMSPSLKQSYLEAQGLYIGGRKNTPAEFYQNYASEANQPAPATQRTSFFGHFARSAKGSSIGSILSSGLKGGIMGSMASGVIGGGAGGSALMDGAIGGSAVGMMGEGGLGALMNPALLPLLAIPLMASVFKAGYSNWQQTAPTSSQLAHGLGTVGQGANALNLSIQKAAAAFGIAGATALQSAQTMAQAFGGNNASVTNLTGQAAQFAMYNGLSDQQQTQIMSAMATMGITSGRGATLTPYAGNRMLTQLTQVSHMQGRQGPLFTGLTSVYGTLASINPTISNPAGVAGQYAAMNASGIQGLQGMRGAALVSQMDQGFASAKGIQQLLGFSAIMKASGGKITDPYQYMSIMEQGSAALIPGTKTTYGAAYLNMVKKITPNKYLQAALMPGLDINQGMAVIKSGALNAPALHVPQGALPLHLTQADKAAIAAAQKSAQLAKLGQTGGIVATLWNQFQANALGGVTGASSLTAQQATLIGGALGIGSSSFGSMAPYAAQVSKQTGIPASYLMAQWAHESAWGGSSAALQNRNLAGIKPSAAHPAGADIKYAGFSSFAQFAQADAQTLMQPRYAHARALAAHGASAQSVFSALASEGYTGSPTQAQATAYGSDIQAIVSEFASAVQRAMDAALTKHRQAQKQDRITQTAHAQAATRGPHR